MPHFTTSIIKKLFCKLVVSEDDEGAEREGGKGERFIMSFMTVSGWREIILLVREGGRGRMRPQIRHEMRYTQYLRKRMKYMQNA